MRIFATKRLLLGAPIFLVGLCLIGGVMVGVNRGVISYRPLPPPSPPFVVDPVDVARAYEQQARSRTSEQQARSRTSATRPLAVSLTDLVWHKGGFGTVMIANFVIKNDEDFAVKDIDVACELTAKSGTPIGYTANTVYQTAPAHRRLAVREFNMGSGFSLDFNQVADAYCKLGGMKRGE